MTKSYATIWKDAKGGDPDATAKLLAALEGDREARAEALGLVYPQTGNAHRIAIAGPLGAGKTTLAAELARRYQASEAKVGVVTVHLAGPRPGADQLGDRLRLNELGLEEGVFLHSLAYGPGDVDLGLRVGLAADAMDALGYDPILLESPGLGKDEAAFLRHAHTGVLVMLPGSSESLDLLVAGVLDTADIVVINKADREGAADLTAQLQQRLEAEATGEWKPRAVSTQALRGEGVDELSELLGSHLEFLQRTGGFDTRRRVSILTQLQEMTEGELLARLWQSAPVRSALEAAADEVADQRVDPAQAAARLAESLLESDADDVSD